jgi:hypothetical protein
MVVLPFLTFPLAYLIFLATDRCRSLSINCFITFVFAGCVEQLLQRPVTRDSSVTGTCETY